MIKKFFITGTDTNVGKTTISSIFLKKASALGYKTTGYKPISSGFQKTIYNIIENDASLLKENSSIKFSDKETNSISFFENAPPHILSEIKGKTIEKKHLSLGLKRISKKSNWILIEGAGGWYTPLSYKETFSDWVKEEKLTVIIVVGIKLGCINHAILTERAILSEKLICGGWVANNIHPKDKYNLYYIQTLLRHIQSPLLGIMPYLKYTNRTNIDKVKIHLPK